MTENSSVKADLVELASFPLVVKLTQGFVNLQVVESHVSDDLLLDNAGVGLVVDAVLQAQRFEFCVSIEAVLHRLGELVSEVLDHLDDFGDVSGRSLGREVKQLTREYDDLAGSVIIDAGNNCGGIGQLVLLKGSVENLLECVLIRLETGFSSENSVKISSSIKPSLIVFS